MIYYVREDSIKINRSFVSVVLFFLCVCSIYFFIASYLDQQNSLEISKNQLKTLTADLQKSTMTIKQLSMEEDQKIKNMSKEIYSLESTVNKEKNIIQSEKKQIDQYKKELQTIISSPYYQWYGYFNEKINNYSMLVLKNGRFMFDKQAHFSPGSARLTKEDERSLDQLIPVLNQLESTVPSNIKWFLRVEGHTDNKRVDTDLYPSNWYLSTARAAKVVEYLIKKGISSKRLMAVGLSDTNPIGDNQTAEGRSQNRRVEFVIGFSE